MIEPVSALVGLAASQALSLVTETGKDVINSLTGDKLVSFSATFKRRIAAAVSLPANHDLVRGIRSAELVAARHVSDAYYKWLYTGVAKADAEHIFSSRLKIFLDERLKLHTDETIDFKSVTPERVSHVLDEMINAMVIEGATQAAHDSRKKFESTFLEELAGKTKVQIPPGFYPFFTGQNLPEGAPRNGGWYSMAALYITEEIKTNERFKSIFCATELVDIKQLMTAADARIADFIGEGVPSIIGEIQLLGAKLGEIGTKVEELGDGVNEILVIVKGLRLSGHSASQSANGLHAGHICADVETDENDSYRFFGPGFEDPEGITDDVWDCYEALFDVEDQALPAEIMSWQRAAYDNDNDWPEVLVTLTRQGKCVGFSYLSIHKPSGWCTGMYFGILEDWRGFGEARRFLNQALKACEQLEPNLRGIIFEVARFDETELRSARPKFEKAKRVGGVPDDLTEKEVASIRAAMRISAYTGCGIGGGFEKDADRQRVSAGAMAVVLKEGKTFRFLDHIQPSIRSRLRAEDGKEEIDIEAEVCSWIMVYPRQRLLRELGLTTPKAPTGREFPYQIKEIFDFLYGEVYAGGYVSDYDGGEAHNTQIEGYAEYLEDVRSRSQSLVGDQQVYLIHQDMVSVSGRDLLIRFRKEIIKMGIKL